ncbi:hypothetical protein VKT23_015712 [Stygiomarasmius scandens]|uniref:Heterokaryon incompatibility domain-containing protein n=1 Tax=Marasmiellus scandens TaxID=2682957 RepID=A0ABR1J0F7_9AGAR
MNPWPVVRMPSPPLSGIPGSSSWNRYSFILPSEDVTTFPYSSISNEELQLLFTLDTVHPYLSHRIVHSRGKNDSTKNPLSPNLIEPIHVCPRRLIDTRTLQLVEFEDPDTIIPPYAILSHRWFPSEEVVYDEFLHPREDTKSKSGYLKIEASAREARQDGISYIWIDTCCIKQGDHADVAANITSMFAFYQNAEVCYAYLVDVGVFDMFSPESQPFLHLESEWFTRGWTLQELVAPRTVIFFNRHWHRIGDKNSDALLRHAIHQRTTIPPSILSGVQSLQEINVLTRMTWSTGRETTKPQDRAYCVQGLLGINDIEPDYNEKPWRSFNRLGKALAQANPQFLKELGIGDGDEVFGDMDSFIFYQQLRTRLDDEKLRMLGFVRGQSYSRGSGND